MYTRPMRPKKPLAFKDGGVVPEIDPVEIDVAPADVAIAPPLSPGDGTDDALRQALQAQQHAEELARTIAADPVAYQIDTIPGLSEHKKNFLKRNRNILDPANVEIMRRVHQNALQEGIPDDTAEMDLRLLEGVNRERQIEIERTRQMEAPPAARAPLSPPPQSRPPAPAPAAPAARRSVPVSAPVSREPPSSNGVRQTGKITLTPEERQIARNSFGGTVGGQTMSNEEKERLYALNKAKYQSMIASGQYSRQSD